MKYAHFIGSILAVTLLLAGCQTTETSGRGTQETKRLAALKRQQQEQHDEAKQNLWTAQDNLLNRDGNPARKP